MVSYEFTDISCMTKLSGLRGADLNRNSGAADQKKNYSATTRVAQSIRHPCGHAPMTGCSRSVSETGGYVFGHW